MAVGSTGSGITVDLARWVSGLTADGISPTVRRHAGRILADNLVCAVAGARTPTARIVREYVRDTDSQALATLVGGGRAAAAGAAFANGTAAHALEMDDGYTLGGSHPGSATVPAVLAAAEEYRADPDRLLAATVAALEVACSVAAAGHPATREQGFHNTAVAGVFGAAAGCSVLMGLSAEQTVAALGMAGSFAGGLFEFLADGSDVKRLHPGKAARDGVVCAELASRGITGPKTVFEGRDGYFAAHAVRGWRPQILDPQRHERGEWAMLDTYFKLYPCCRHAHAAVDAALALRSRLGSGIHDLRRILVRTYGVAARHDGVDVSTELAAQLSLPYAVAAALRWGRLGLGEFGGAARADERARRIMALVEVVEAEEFSDAYPTARPAEVTVWTGDDQTFTALVKQPYGEPSNPVDDAVLAGKAHRLADAVLGELATDRLVRAAHDFDLPELIRLLSKV